MSTPPVALTIAGSDSGGGAGIQADLATFAALGVHGASAVTAVTAQDTRGVHAIHAVPTDVIAAQIEAVLTDLRPSAVKIGILGSAAAARTVADVAGAGRLPCLVVDPVLVSTSGHSLAATGVMPALIGALLPHADLITPNTDEAAALLGADPPTSIDEQADHARALLALGPRAVVVTGGIRRSPHGVERVDVLVRTSSTLLLDAPEIPTENDHGTGCTFAAAVAAHLALGQPLTTAVDSARHFVRRALIKATDWRLGHGRGPIAHTTLPGARA